MRRVWSLALLFVLLVIALSLFVPFRAAEPDETAAARLLRFPTLSCDSIAFVYAGDVWSVPRAGGLADTQCHQQGSIATNYETPAEGRSRQGRPLDPLAAVEDLGPVVTRWAQPAPRRIIVGDRNAS
jgi:hypothetical protein